MAKEEKKLIPEIKASNKPQLLSETFTTIHKPGMYLIEQPDGTLINVTPTVFRRAYESKDGFTVKKSPNQ